MTRYRGPLWLVVNVLIGAALWALLIWVVWWALTEVTR